HGNDQETGDLPGSEGGQEVGVADVLEKFQGARFDGTGLFIEAYKLQGDPEAARPFGHPHFAEAPGSQALNQVVSWRRLAARLQAMAFPVFVPRYRHGRPPWSAAESGKSGEGSRSGLRWPAHSPQGNPARAKPWWPRGLSPS